MNSEKLPADCHRVEVSGWDASENFFVEKTTVRWNRGKNAVVLRCALRAGSVVFLRSLERSHDEGGFPIAWKAVNVVGRDAGGQALVHLVQLHPRPSGDEKAEELESAASRVA